MSVPYPFKMPPETAGSPPADSSPQPLRALIVEDRPHDARLLVRVLTKGGFAVTWERVDSAGQMRSQLESSTWDVIISDYTIPGFGGLEALGLCRELDLDIPFIVVSGDVGEEVAVECMRRGAHDYLMKDRLTRLCEAVRRETREADIRLRHRQAEAALVRSEMSLRQVWEHVEAGIVLVDTETREILDVNDEAVRLIQAPREEIIGSVCHKFICPAECDCCPVLDLGNEVDRAERVLLRSDGEAVPIIKSVTPIRRDDRDVLLESFVDISGLKEAERRQELHAQVLETLNRPNEWRELVRDLVVQIKEFTAFDAVGIRLSDGDDFPYYETVGFSQEFVEKERHLCQRDGRGAVVRDSAGDPCLECMCGNVIRGRADPSQPFFTERGSFWAGNTTRLLAETTEKERQSRTRNRCDGAGYESVGLIPVRAGDRTIGLLQLNDRRTGRLTLDMVRFFEEMANSIGIAYTRQLERRALQEGEQALRTSREKYRSMVDSVGIGVALISPDMRILELNRQMREWFPDVDTGQCPMCYDAFNDPPRDSVCDYCPTRKTLEDGKIHEALSTTLLRGSSRNCRIISSPVSNDKGEVTAVIELVEDMTDRLSLEAQLRHAQKLESIGTLAGGVAHEINNPIMGVMNYAQLIVDKLGQDSPVAEYAIQIGKETQRVATIVRNLLSFARHDKKAHSHARVCDIVEGTLSLVRTVLRHDQITLEVNVAEELPQLTCRSQQLQQVLMNLITNARDALNERYPKYDEDKQIILNAECGTRSAEGNWERLADTAIPNPQSASPDPQSPIRNPQSVVPDPQSAIRNPQSVVRNRYVRVTVEDHGAGFSEDVRERMFEPFYTTKPKDIGTGLGLSISYGIVTDHGGALSVERKPGEWTRFHMDLPVDDGA